MLTPSPRPAAGVLALTLLLGGCASLPQSSGPEAEPTPHVVYLFQSGWHTSLLLDAPPVLARSAKLRRDFHDNQYLVVGWGDGDYFVSEQPGWTLAVKAMVASSHPALQVGSSHSNPPPDIAQHARVALAISERGLQQLVAYIDRSIAEDGNGQPIYLGQPRPNVNLFYQATGNYSAFNNCNSWTQQALQAAGLPISGSFNLTAQSVFEQASRIAAQQREQALLAPRALPPG